MTSSMASAKHQHRGHQSPACPTSARSIHSQVHDVVSATRERFNDVVSSVQNRHGIEQSSPSSRVMNLVGLRDGLDAIVKVMFAPCVSVDIGGVPRGEMPPGANARTTPTRAVPTPGGGGKGTVTASTTTFGTPVTPPWGASIPFEVSASSNLGTSLVHTQSSLQELVSSSTTTTSSPSRAPPQHRHKLQHKPSPTARERRMAESHARLRQLGARHQLAGGFPGENLADTARPINPADDAREEVLKRDPRSPELVDFDDGISAISSHTLEEMERRHTAKERAGGGRAAIIMKVNPHDFTQTSMEGCEDGGWRQWGGDRLDLVEEVEEKNTEVVFCDPFYKEEEEEYGISHNNNGFDLHKKTAIDRVASNRTNITMNTTGTDSSHEFEELYRRQENLYWQDQDHVADVEHSSRGLTHNHAARPRHRMSIEERARRLREISRSRSDRTSSSCSSSKSRTSSSLSSHPHDTFPINTSEIFRKSSHGIGDGVYMRQNNPPKHSQRRLLNPFAMLDHDEI